MRYDPTFVGVFPLNRIPHLRKKSNNGFIVNTQTDNLPGQHWIAVRTMLDRAWIFDPMASHPPPPALCHHLLLYCNISFLYVCKVSIQPALTLTCGHHCVYFLYHNLPALSENDVIQYINKLDV
jgi:hypothetical protein